MLEPALLQRVEKSARRRIASVRAIQRGYTPALRLQVVLEDGGSVFVKVGTTRLTSNWLQ
jgi:hypothetical protein